MIALHAYSFCTQLRQSVLTLQIFGANDNVAIPR